MSSSLDREHHTVAAMIRLYCRDQHGSGELCAECQRLLSYADARLARCPFGESKTTCAQCPVHCYQPQMREKIRSVMRYAGPRMLRHHPAMALRHLVDGLRKTPARLRKPSR